MMNQKSAIQTNDYGEFDRWFEAEATSSGIPMNSWKRNVVARRGWELLEILAPDLWEGQKQRNCANAKAGREAARYKSVIHGGAWVATGWGAHHPVVKAIDPRWHPIDQKFIKYETPKGTEAAPFFPWVGYGEGLKIADRLGRKELAAYQQRMGLQDLEAIDQEFWNWAIERGWSITITEGVKKALALISHGVAAIGLRGITQWRVPKTNSLAKSLALFGTNGRKWSIALDQDAKPTTRANVRGQVLKLASAIEKKSGIGSASVLEWSPEIGKGIDDVLVAAEDPVAVLAEIFAKARLTAAYKRDLETNLTAIADLQKFTAQPPTIGERLPILPELEENQLMAIDATMGSGKTHRIIRDLIAPAREADRLSIVIAPNNNLGIQFAQAAGLPHIHNYGTSQANTEALKFDIYNRCGVVLCMDSLPRLLAVCPGILTGNPLLVIDEVNQVLGNLSTAGTMGKRQPEGVKAIADLIGSAHSIAIAEAGIPDRCVRLIQSAKQSKFLEAVGKIDPLVPVKLADRAFKLVQIHHRNPGNAWAMDLYESSTDSEFLAEFFAAIEQGGRHYFATTSKAKAKQLELIISEAFPQRRVVRIDSETTEGGVYDRLFADPSTWIREEAIDILIATPTLQSGISIDGGKTVEESYFTDVWGHFPSLAPDLHMQQLARVRPAVKRHVWVAQTIRRSPAESSPKAWGLQRFWGQDAAYQAGQHGMNQPAEMEGLEASMQKFCAETMVADGLQKAIAFEYLKHRMEQCGHIANVIKAKKNASIVEQFKAARLRLELDEATAIILIPINPELDTPEWAIEELASTGSTVESRRKANKVLARQRFPGCLFDSLEEALSLVDRYGSLGRAAELRAAAENPEAERAIERSAVVGILSSAIRNYHLLPKGANKGQLIKDIGILELIDSGIEYSRDSELVRQIAEKAIERSTLIWQFFGLNVSEGQDLITIVHRLLKKLGYEITTGERPGAIVRTGRKGAIGNQVQHYQIVEHPDPVYYQLLTAARARRDVVAAISKGVEEPPTNDCNHPETIALGRFEGAAMPFLVEGDPAGRVLPYRDEELLGAIDGECGSED